MKIKEKKCKKFILEMNNTDMNALYNLVNSYRSSDIDFRHLCLKILEAIDKFNLDKPEILN